MTKSSKTLLTAAVTGILGAALSAAPALAKQKKMDKMGASGDSVECYGVNKCAGTGKCGGKGHDCAGKNTCKGQGWLPMPKDSCLAIEGGATEAPKKS